MPMKTERKLRLGLFISDKIDFKTETLIRAKKGMAMIKHQFTRGYKLGIFMCPT